MSTITIRNIGPIKSLTMKLNKINVIMGPQSSGKSTIAKIISFCSWLEKGVENAGQITHSLNNLTKVLKDYHRLSETYFDESSEIYYEGEQLAFSYNNHSVPDWEFNVLHLNEKEYIYERVSLNKKNFKVIYIPSERNFVSVVPNLREYAEDNDNLMDFIRNWYEAKRKYDKLHALKILDLDVDYYNIENSDTDNIILENGKEIKLKSASSGLQSLIPLITLYDYVVKGIYTEEKPISVELRDIVLKRYKDLLQQRKINNQKVKSEDISTLLDIIISKKYSSSKLIIEEPEQNLFPEAQRDLVYYMIQMLNESERKHDLILTTHSPYILYALNNCMMAGLVYEKMSEKSKQKLKCKLSRIDPKMVSIFQITDGEINSIQQKDGLIGNNFFDEKMKDLMDDFYTMLNYYGK